MDSIDKLKQRATDLYLNSPYCCAEVVLKSTLEYFSIPHDELLIKAAAGFSGGVGGSGCVCGTIVGASMAIGIFMEKYHLDKEGKEIKKVTHKVFQYFQNSHKVPCCRILTKNTKQDDKLKKQTCSNLVAEMTAFTVLLIEEEKNTA